MPKTKVDNSVAKPHVRKGDTVQVISGKDVGKRGKVMGVFPDRGRVMVEGVARTKRHIRPSRKNLQGGTAERENPVHLSNVMPVCPSCSKATRVGRREGPDGKGIRVCRKCGEDIDRS